MDLSIGKLIKKYLPTVIVLSISVCAFFAGFIQNSFIEDASELQSSIENLKFQRDEIQEYSNTILRNDGYVSTITEEREMEAYNLAIEYWALAYSLTAQENETYVSQIVGKLGEAFGFNVITYAYQYASYFYNNPSSNELEVLNLEENGVELVIERDLWEEWVPISNTPIVTYLTTIYGGYPEDIILDILAHPDIPLEMYYLSIADFEEVFFEIVESLNSEIELLQLQFFSTRNTASQLNLGVAITAVATVLAGAMSNRLGSKEMEHNISLIRSDYLNDESVIKPDKDLIAIPVLFLAAILSSLGVLIPIIATLM